MNGQPGENAYTIIETLHRSRQFFVYKARNYFSGRIVCIKTNDKRFRDDTVQVRQLRDEAETGLRLKHFNIRETIGLFEDGSAVYMVSEFLEGDPLDSILRIPHVDISYSQAIKWILQLLDALDHAHKHLILHLNLDPSNIIVTPDYNLKVFGFGRSPHAWKNADPEGHVFHPVLFTPPEVFWEQNPDQRSDLYSVGVIAWLLLRGKLPWEQDRRESPSASKQRILTAPPLNPDLPGRHIPIWLFSILNMALQTYPNRRFASAGEMREAITSQKVVSPSSDLALVDRDPVRADDNRFSPYSVPQPTPDLTQPRSAAPSSEDITAETPSASIRVQSKDISPELKRMQKTFRILGIISLIIVAYIVLKYFVIKDRPVFNRAGESTSALASDPSFSVENKPPQMISVPGGTAVVGNTGPDAANNEFPLLQVQLAPFMIGAREITRGEWAMAVPGYTFTDEASDLPVTGISFYEVVEYCNEKSRLDGLQPCYEFLGNGVICDFNANGYRLPTEAEWEFAAKAGRNDNFTPYSGSSTPDAVAWHFANSGGNLQPVGQKQANQIGLYDLSGNAAEWVWNWYASYAGSFETPFAGPDNGTDKVVRGGSFRDRPENIRVTMRAHAKPFTKATHIGFRVARKK